MLPILLGDFSLRQQDSSHLFTTTVVNPANLSVVCVDQRPLLAASLIIGARSSNRPSLLFTLFD